MYFIIDIFVIKLFYYSKINFVA